MIRYHTLLITRSKFNVHKEQLNTHYKLRRINIKSLKRNVVTKKSQEQDSSIVMLTCSETLYLAKKKKVVKLYSEHIPSLRPNSNLRSIQIIEPPQMSQNNTKKQEQIEMNIEIEMTNNKL